MDFALYRTIARQGGVFPVSQALDSCSDAEVRSLVRTGRWRRARWRGVPVDGDTPDSFAVQVRAAALVVGSDLVACHSTAARLWDFDVLDGDVLHNAALRSAWCTRDDLAAAAAAQAGLRQVIRLRDLVRHADPRIDSPMESRMRWRFLDAGFPAPDLQVEVPVDGRARWMDIGWRAQRVGAEFDGQEAHMTREQLRDDRRRHNWLTENGWTLLHFTGPDVYRAHREMLSVTARALELPPGSWRS